MYYIFAFVHPLPSLFSIFNQYILSVYIFLNVYLSNAFCVLFTQCFSWKYGKKNLTEANDLCKPKIPVFPRIVSLSQDLGRRKHLFAWSKVMHRAPLSCPLSCVPLDCLCMQIGFQRTLSCTVSLGVMSRGYGGRLVENRRVIDVSGILEGSGRTWAKREWRGAKELLGERERKQ